MTALARLYLFAVLAILSAPIVVVAGVSLNEYIIAFMIADFAVVVFDLIGKFGDLPKLLGAWEKRSEG